MSDLTVSTHAPIVTFEAFAVAKGKGITAGAKVAQAANNGAHLGALVAVNKHRKAAVATIAATGMDYTIHALSAGNIRPAYALVVEVSGAAESMLTEDGKAPYSEWLRLGATLAAKPQITKAGKPTNAAKALAVHRNLTAQAQALRDERAKAKALAASQA